ncbi:MAG: hypothetical protein FWF27_05790 [Candidatus Bathyarchaeota archaeon]|nr:hypothetical protein [Candidatus Termiticorpusculum sp.]
MKIEKKLITLSILAFIIGLAIILPPYLTLGIGATAKIKPISNVNMILYAHAVPTTHINGENKISGQTINLLTNFTLNPDVAIANLKNVDAQIEIYNFHVYSDKTSIANITYCIPISKYIPDPNNKRGYTSAIQGSGNGFWIFKDGTKFDIKDVDIIGYTEGNDQSGFTVGKLSLTEENGYSYTHECDKMLQRGFYVGSSFAAIYNANGEQSLQAQKNIENAQILYIDVTRIMTVIYKHQDNTSDTTTSPTSSTITTTMVNNKVICHIELSKNDWGFASGPIPNFMQTDANYRYILPPSAFSNPQLPKEEYRIHMNIIDYAP